jgi:hypothetical protein
MMASNRCRTLTLPYTSPHGAHALLTLLPANGGLGSAALSSQGLNLKENSMNKPLIAALVATVAFSALPALASPVSASANGQTAVTSGLATGTVVAQSNDSDNQSDSGSSSSQSNDNGQ